MNVPCVIEAILFVSGEPVELGELARALDLTEIEVNDAIMTLQEEYEKNERGIQLIRFNSLVQLKTNETYAAYINRMFQPPQKYNLTQSAIETLSIIAYRQPVTKAEIEAVRGVKSDYSISVLQEKRLICAVGRKDTIGKPILYGTTEEFLRHFGISSLEELPSLEELQENLPADTDNTTAEE